MKPKLLTITQLANFLDNFLNIRGIDDAWCVNGVQIPGKSEIKKIALGVSATKNFLEQSATWQADAVIVHHGLFWKQGIRSVSPLLAARLRIVFVNNMSLLAYHLPLDAHSVIGNNTEIARALFPGKIRMQGISAVLTMQKSVPFCEFLSRCEEIFGQQPIFSSPKQLKQVTKIGICSGGGADFVHELLESGIDTFLTGEISEHHYHDFAELGVRFAACGHYATEMFGIKALGKVISQQFPHVTISFFPESCPV